jgi:hypothetical protein
MIVFFELGSQVVSISLILADIYPLFTHILMLTYIEPYRKSVLKLFRLDGFLNGKVINIQHKNK